MKKITEEDTTQDIKGYLDLQAEKFKEYLGSVSRHIQNERLKESEGKLKVKLEKRSKTMSEIRRICTNCAIRHDMCGYDYMTDNCENFVIGKCFICANRDKEELCQAEDMSGFPCRNFKKESEE